MSCLRRVPCATESVPRQRADANRAAQGGALGPILSAGPLDQLGSEHKGHFYGALHAHVSGAQ